MIGGTGRARERRWRTFTTLLVVITGTPAIATGAAVADLLLAAEENPATAELPASSGRCRPPRRPHPARTRAAVWHPLSGEGRPPVGWTAL